MAVLMHYGLDFSSWGNALQEATRRAGDMTHAFRQVGEVLVKQFEENILNQGLPPGSWPELSETTLLQRAKGRMGKTKVYKDDRVVVKRGIGPGMVIERTLGTRQLTRAAQKNIEKAKALILSARLLRSLTYAAFASFVDAGSNVVYAAHQFFGTKDGARRKWGHGTVGPIPARNPFGLSDGTKAEIRRILLTELLAWRKV